MKQLYFKHQTIWHCGNPPTKLDNIKKIVKYHLKKLGCQYRVDKTGNIFVGNFEQKKPCLIAHLDSVFDNQPKKVKLNHNILSSKTGLGADDKAGIVAILEILESKLNVNAILTIDEEIGGVGARQIDPQKLENVSYFIEIDRRGKNDLITSIYREKIASQEFLADIESIIKKYKFQFEDGMYTDVYDLCQLTEISAINISCGYYNPHSAKEYIRLNELQHTINFIKEILQKTQKQYKIKFIRDYILSKDDFINTLNYVNNIQELIDLVHFYGDFEIDDIIRTAYRIGQNEQLPLTNTESMAYLTYNLKRGSKR